MKICVDARMTGSSPHGIARYADGLLRLLPAALPEVEWSALVQGGRKGPGWARVESVPVASPLYGLREQIEVPRALRALRADLFHSPTFSAPLRAPCPVVMTVHDLIHLRFPDDYGWRHRGYYRWIVGPSARRCERVITVSETSKKDLVDRLAIEPERVAVIPHALSAEWFRPPSESEAVRRATGLGVRPPWWLWVGNPKPHKGLDLLVRAWSMFGAGGATLVLVGSGRRAPAGAGKAVALEGIEDEALKALYRGATALVAPSRWEGFNLPILEAMAAGTPVVASDLPAHREVAGAAALYAPAGDATALARALSTLDRDRLLRRRLASAGRKRARTFRLEREVRQTLAVYRACLPHPG